MRKIRRIPIWENTNVFMGLVWGNTNLAICEGDCFYFHIGKTTMLGNLRFFLFVPSSADSRPIRGLYRLVVYGLCSLP